MSSSPISVTTMGQHPIQSFIPVGQSSRMGPAKEKLIQTIALMEYQAKSALQERVHDCPTSDLFAEVPELREHMQSLELLKNLQMELEKHEKQARELQYRMSSDGINSEISKAKKEAQKLEEELQALKKAKTEIEGDKRVEHNKLIEAQRMCQFLQGRVVKITDETKEMENNLTIQINKLNFQLTNAKMISNFLEQKLNEMKKQKENSELEASKIEANLKFQLTNANSISEFVKAKLKESQEKANELEAKICKLDFALTNSQSIGKFVEGKLTQTQQDNKSLKENIAQLESQINSLKVRLALKNDLIERKDQQYKDQVASSQQIEKELLKYKGKLNATNKMTVFLQAQLAESEEHQFTSFDRIASDPLREEVTSLKSSLGQSEKKFESLQKKLNMAEEEKWVAESRVRELESKLQFAESKLQNSNTSVPQNNAADLQAQLKELTAKLIVAQEASKSADIRASEMQDQLIGGDAHGALLDLEFRLTQSEVANKALRNEMATLTQQKEEADAKIQELERRLQKRY